MAKNNNKGFSLIEVIIAVAVFAILIAPLTAQLISAINVNTKSTKKQYAIEKAEEIMESFKTANMKESAISIPDGNSTGNYEFGLDDSQTQTYTLPESAGTVDYHINTYSCSGISLGGEYEKYDCTVTVNDIAHAVATKGYVWDANTNDLKKDGSEYVRLTSGVGTVRNLDNKQSAIIAGATYMGATSGIEGNSLDNQAAAYFKDVKVDILKGNSVLYNQYLSGATYLDNDSFQKTTTIKVSKTLSGYMVQCFVEYQDKPSFNPIIKAYTNGIARYQSGHLFYTMHALLFNLLDQFLWNICHFFRICNSFFMHPFKYLFCTECRLSDCLYPDCQFIKHHGADIQFFYIFYLCKHIFLFLNHRITGKVLCSPASIFLSAISVCAILK